MKEPKIRLKGFTGEWEKRFLEDLCTTITPSCKLQSNDYLETGMYPVVDQSQSLICGWTNSASGLITNTPVIVFGDHTCALKHIDFPFIQGADGVKILSPKKGYVSQFLYQAFLSNPIKQDGYKRHFTEFKEKFFFLPSNEDEQKKIADCLSEIDSTISLLGKKIDSLKQVKAASLQSMFPQEGETTPRVRFKGFVGDWDVVTIDSICKKSVSKHSENSLGENVGQYPIYGASGYIQNIETYDFDVPYVGVIKDGSGVGRSQLYPAYSSILGTMQYILPKGDMDVTFLAYLFETINFSSYVNGSSIPHIYFKDYSIKNVKVPSINEQRVIGEYFQNLDSQIALLSQQLEKLQQIKSACLDNMFV